MNVYQVTMRQATKYSVLNRTAHTFAKKEDAVAWTLSDIAVEWLEVVSGMEGKLQTFHIDEIWVYGVEVQL